MDNSGSTSEQHYQNEIVIPPPSNDLYKTEIFIMIGDEEQHTTASSRSTNQNSQHTVGNGMIVNEDRPITNTKPIISWLFWLLGLAVLVAVIVASIIFSSSPTGISPPQITTTTAWKTTTTTTTETSSALLSSSEPTSEPEYITETGTVRTVSTYSNLELSRLLPSNTERTQRLTFPVTSQTTNDLQRCDSSPDNSLECNTSDCVAATSVCDGHVQCPDQSDEWNCTQLDPDGTLRFRRKSSTHLTVCGDDWNTEQADLVCSELGYVGAANFSFIGDSKRSEGYSMYRVTAKDRLTFKLIDSTQCNKGILRLQCQEYHCGRKANQSTMDKRYQYRIILQNTICPSLALAFSSHAGIKCTANIVSPRWALTSYTCIENKTKIEDEMKWRLFAGPEQFSASSKKLSTTHIEESLQIVDIKRIVPYPKNNQSMYADDVALLELATPLQLNDVIGSVCLTETNSAIDPKQRCLTTGWESDLNYASPTQQYMTNVSAVNVHMGHCNSYNGELPDTTICVEPLISDQTTCYNDAGAPLMCYVAATGQWQLQGILSKHSNCGNRPAIYNSITPAIATWIRHMVGNGHMFEHMNVTK